MLRDEVWDQALQFLAEGEVVSLLKLEFSSSQLVSAKRILRDMEKLGWLTKRSDDPPAWGAGPVAQRYLNLPKPIRPTGEDDWRDARDDTDPEDDRLASEILRESRGKTPGSRIADSRLTSRDGIDSFSLGTCNNCGCELSSEDTVYESHWFRYEGSNDAAGNGWVAYCEDCAPPGML
jgi:hypothetical protein